MDILHLHLNNNVARTLNQECDNEATKHYNDPHYLRTPVTPQQINIFFQGKIHTSKTFHFLHDIHQEQMYQTYLKERFQWTDQNLHIIDWKVIEAYMKTLPISKKVHYIKLSHKWRSTHHKLFQTSNGESQPPSCPLCGADKEDDDHPFQCINPIMQIQF